MTRARRESPWERAPDSYAARKAKDLEVEKQIVKDCAGKKVRRVTTEWLLDKDPYRYHGGNAGLTVRPHRQKSVEQVREELPRVLSDHGGSMGRRQLLRACGCSLKTLWAAVMSSQKVEALKSSESRWTVRLK